MNLKKADKQTVQTGAKTVKHISWRVFVCFLRRILFGSNMQDFELEQDHTYLVGQPERNFQQHNDDVQHHDSDSHIPESVAASYH